MTHGFRPTQANRDAFRDTSVLRKELLGEEERSERVCLICGKRVPDAHQPYGWLEKVYGNGLLCGRGECLRAAWRRAVEYVEDPPP